ncbi:MAG TPA: UDP-glucose 4-epimerase GalE [Caulobacteraceae bacterium]|nr:UDP-glucose 4-epimerase GalE [Caulobacteraceae bacterium]
MSAVLVTGGAGYIGSHAALALLGSGYQVVVLDDFSTGVRSLVPQGVQLFEGDVADRALTARLLRSHAIGAVMHFAGSIIVPESVQNPTKYYRNNTAGTLALLESCVEAEVRHFIFSSTATLYAPSLEPMPETFPTAPISPYGASKLFSERMIMDTAAAHPAFRPVCLRYFNVAGADPAGRSGQSGPQSTHLIRVAVETTLGRRPFLEVFGGDYPTRDGTGVRDYIHVSDLADAHVAALRYLEEGGEPAIFNCGYGTGYTVLEVIAALERVTGAPLPTKLAPRRAGDPASLIADPTELARRTGWQPKHADLDAIVASALAWARKSA